MIRFAVRRSAGAAVLMALVWALLPGPSRAQEGDGAKEAEAVPERREDTAPETLDPATPRGAMTAYLVAARAGDFAEAARHLDLAPIPAGEREERGPALAQQLKIVLDQELWVDLESLSDRPEGDREDGLPARRDRVGSIDTARGSVPVFLDRDRDPSGAEVWLVSPLTVSRIPDLYDQYGYGPLVEWLPPFLFRSELFEVQLWQWLALLVAVVLAYAAGWLVVRVGFTGIAGRAANRSATDLDDRIIEAAVGPLRLIATLALFHLGLLQIGLAAPAHAFLVSVEQVLAVVAVTWLLLRIVDIGGSVAERGLVRAGSDSATALIPLGRKVLKCVVVGLALLASLDSFGFDVTALIAGLGVGGLAFALAAQRTIENLFGGATLLADRPVQVGDFCRFGDRVGTVEEIGVRSTRVRTLDRTLVTVPNAEFSTLQLENFAARDRIWFHPTLGLRYETSPDQMRTILKRIRRMLLDHERVDPDPARVRFVGFGASSLDLEVFAYVRTSDWADYLEVAEDLNLRIMDIVEEAGSGFAFPSTTTYLAQDTGLDEEKVRAAEAAARAQGAGETA